MASHKTGRAAGEIKKELSELIRTLKDPRISGLLSIVEVDLTNDLSYCTVYISSLEGIEQTQEAVKGLKSASSFIRREIGKRVNLRKLPEFIFVADNGIEHSAQLGKIMLDLKSKKSKGETDES